MPGLLFLGRLAVGFGLGASASVLGASPPTAVCAQQSQQAYMHSFAAVNPPSLKNIMDTSKDIIPIKLVIVGGGYSGSRLAFQFDSIFDVTLIDEKNFIEQAADVVPLIARKWSESSDDMVKQLTSVHRFYLKRANVVTGTAEEISESQVTLRDGRVVDYDLLIVALGEKKPFPFGTNQKTLAGRVEELRHFNSFLCTRRKVAIVGGGPMGVSLAGHLAEDKPDMEVHLFHSGSNLLPALPTLCQDYAEESLAKFPNLHLHLSSRVSAVEEKFDASHDAGKVGVGSWFSRLVPWGKERKGDEGKAPRVADSYSLQVDTTERIVRRKRSLLHHVYFGPAYRSAAPPPTATKRETYDGFDYVFSLTGDTPREVPGGILRNHVNLDGHLRVSILNQIFGFPNVFAVGRCTNLPVVRSTSFSDAQTRCVFRNLLAVMFTPKTERYLHASDGVSLQNYVVPRIIFKTAALDAIGCNSWGGPMVSSAALVEYVLEKKHLQGDFVKPLFFKRQDPGKVKTRIRNWLEHEITDICDFSF